MNKKEQKFTERTFDKLLHGYDNKTTQLHGMYASDVKTEKITGTVKNNNAYTYYLNKKWTTSLHKITDDDTEIASVKYDRGLNVTYQKAEGNMLQVPGVNKNYARVGKFGNTAQSKDIWFNVKSQDGNGLYKGTFAVSADAAAAGQNTLFYISAAV